MADEVRADDGVRMPPEREIMNESWKSLLVGVPKRALCLVKKLICVKGAILAVATWLLLVTDKFPAWAWVTIAGFVIGGREFMKFVKDVRR